LKQNEEQLVLVRESNQFFRDETEKNLKQSYQHHRLRLKMPTKYWIPQSKNVGNLKLIKWHFKPRKRVLLEKLIHGKSVYKVFYQKLMP
jgi:hypothetical protein